jgi:hypothetical protein
MSKPSQTAPEQWEFRCDTATGGWRWRQRGGGGAILASSLHDFPSLVEAIEDAKNNGFRYDRAAPPR